jgi:hypothetical protein
MVGLFQSVQTLGDSPQRRQLRSDALRQLGYAAQGNVAVRGAALGLLFGDGQVDSPALAAAFRGHLLGGGMDGSGGADFLRGLLRTARSAIWQVSDIIADLHQVLGQMSEEQFIRQLPLLRLALADLTPRETDVVAKAVAAHAGVKKLEPASSRVFSSSDLALAVSVEVQIRKSLANDGLAMWEEGKA